MQEKLSILSFGAGAIGTYIGGSLALNGHKVVFIEKPEAAQELARRGLRLQLEQEEHVLASPETASSLDTALARGRFDLALFAVKSYDTQGAVEDFTPFADRMPPVLSFQNGVENEALIASVLGEEKVIAGTVTSSIGRRAVGDIVLERLRGIGVAGDHPLSISLASALNDAGLNARLYARAADMKWSKMLTNLLANATSAILDMSPSEVFNHPGLFRLEIRQLREAMRVMNALNIHLVDLPGTPVRMLAFGVQGLPPQVSRPLMKNAVGGGRGGKMPSFYIDLRERKGRSEVDYLNGAVVRFGAQAGVPTPANRLLNETLLALTNGTLPLDTFRSQPEKLLKRLQSK